MIAMEPQVLILDEPTAGLDAAGRDAILKNICDYQRSQNAAVLMVSHSMEEVASICDRLVVLYKSHIAMDDTPEVVFARSEELLRMGLDVPQVTSVCMKLRQMGLALPESIYTLDQALSALEGLRKGGVSC